MEHGRWYSCVSGHPRLSVRRADAAKCMAVVLPFVRTERAGLLCRGSQARAAAACAALLSLGGKRRSCGRSIEHTIVLTNAPVAEAVRCAPWRPGALCAVETGCG